MSGAPQNRLTSAGTCIYTHWPAGTFQGPLFIALVFLRRLQFVPLLRVIEAFRLKEFRQMQENPAGRSSNISVGAFDSVNVKSPDSQEVIEMQVFSHASPMTPGGQQANPESSTGVKKKRGRPRTGQEDA